MLRVGRVGHVTVELGNREFGKPDRGNHLGRVGRVGLVQSLGHIFPHQRPENVTPTVSCRWHLPNSVVIMTVCAGSALCVGEQAARQPMHPAALVMKGPRGNRLACVG